MGKNDVICAYGQAVRRVEWCWFVVNLLHHPVVYDFLHQGISGVDQLVRCDVDTVVSVVTQIEQTDILNI